jgi:hypothetical protein
MTPIQKLLSQMEAQDGEQLLLETKKYVYPNFAAVESIVDFKNGWLARNAEISALRKALAIAVEALADIRKYSLGSKADTCDEAEAAILKALEAE